MLLLLFILFSLALADTGTLIIASQSTITDAWKALIAHVYYTMMYSPNVEHQINLFDGTHRILDWTSTLQRDTIIQGINQVVRNNTCNWSELLSMPIESYGHYIFIFTDGNYCGPNPMEQYVGLESRYHRDVFPIAVGPNVNMLNIIAMAGACPQPRGCVEGRDYLHLFLDSKK